MGRRIKGVEHIEVNRGNGEIRMEFDGNPATVEKIQGFVRAIGYEAILREQTNDTQAQDSQAKDSR